MTNRITLDQANQVIAARFAKGKELESQAAQRGGGRCRRPCAGLPAPGRRVFDAAGYRAGQGGGRAGAGRLLAARSARWRWNGRPSSPPFPAFLPHGLVPAAGGVIVKGSDGFAIGAVGITGDTSGQ